MELKPAHACEPAAFEYFKAQANDLHSTNGLLRAAIAVSMHGRPSLNPLQAERRIDQLVGRIRARVRSQSRQAMLAHLHDELFDRLGMQGNFEDYYAADNSYVPVVLETGVGIPITLSLIYTVVARRLGLIVDGVNAPNHFLVRVVDSGGSLLIDPYNRGRLLCRRDARHIIEQASGLKFESLNEVLRPATHRQWIQRLIRNLITVFEAEERDRDVTAMQELLQQVQPARS